MQDIYKSCFQDRFGVVHALAQRDIIERYILREIELATDFEEPYIEPCGWRGCYVRINLKAVKDGKIRATELADAFIASAAAVTSEDLQSWREEWEGIETAVRGLYPTLDGFEEDSAMIRAVIERGEYAVHHSKIYNEKYNPHYRIVSRNEYNKLKDRLK